MKDERYWVVLGTWLKDTAEAPPDPRQTARRVAERLPSTPQLRRRWWLPSPRRSPTPPHGRNQATDHVASATGMTRLMFSPIRAIIAGALVFATGGVLLIAQPFDQQGGVPGAEQAAELAPPVKATITATEVTGAQDEGCTDGSGNALETCTCNVPEICTWHSSDQWSATDPRLSGTATRRATEQWWPNGGDRSLYPVFEAYAVEVVNDEGRWVGTARGAGPLGGQGYLTLTGEGGYDGFTAVVVNDPTDSDDDGITTKVAVIIEGELPPFPELPAAE